MAWICDLTDEYARLPMTPDDQSDKENSGLQINPNLNPEQRTTLLELLQEYGDVFSDTRVHLYHRS